MFTLYNGNNEIHLPVTDDSYSYNAVMRENSLTLYFSSERFFEIPVGSYCDFFGERYSLKKESNFTKQGTRNYEYTLLLETDQADLKLWKIRNPVDNRIKFSYTATPREHLELFVANANRRSSGWKVGECIEGKEVTFEYNHTYIFDGLNDFASQQGTEWQIINKTVHLRKVEYNKENPLVLSYGKGNGFKTGVGREAGEVPVEILLVQGTDKNIDFSKYGSKELLLPKSQTLTYEGRTYKTSADGLSVMRADKALTTGHEDSLDCSEIIPSREGTVGSVIQVDAEKNFYDFIDNSIPDDLNFEEYLIEGENMTVIFQTGMLAGRGEFEVKYFHEPKTVAGKEKAGKRFEIVPQEIDGITMPDGGVWMPQPGDKYSVFGIQLPDAYICDNATKTGASWEMFREAVKCLYECEDKKFTFIGTLDGIWAKKRWLQIGGKIVLGGYVLFSDEHFMPEGSLIRITGVKRYVNKPYMPEIELSNTTSGTSISSDLNKPGQNEVVIEDKYKDALSFTKRRFRDAKETMSMLEDALLNFSGAINPIAIQTMQLLVGDESLQFRFVNSMTNPVQVPHNITYDIVSKVLHVPSGLIQHMTMGINDISSAHKVSDYKFWNVSAYNSPSLIEGNAKYYLYAKVSKSDKTGTFLLSENAIKIEQVNGYYHLLVGVLNSEFEGERSFVELYGFTEVLPGRITTERIVSSDGLNFMDFVKNAFRVGNEKNYFDWNTKTDGKLRLKGTIIQSESGDESPIGCFRGEYHSDYVYYPGDEVTYNDGTGLSTYRYINETPSKGNAPTNGVYWQVVAKGEKGDEGVPGDSFEHRYAKNGSRTIAPPLDRTSPVPSGWSTSMPAVGMFEYLWMTSAKKSHDGKLLLNWSNPARTTPYDGIDGKNGIDGTDGLNGKDGISLIYKGEFSNHPANPQNGWYYRNTTTKKSYVYQDNAWYVMTVDGVNGTNGNNGKDGLSVVWKGDSSVAPSNPQKNWCYRDTDNGRVYIYNGSAWELMTKDGNDGANGANGSDGHSVYITYNDSTSKPSKPTGNGTTNGWHTNVTDDIVWMAQKVASSASAGTWGDPIKIRGIDGKDGIAPASPFRGEYKSDSIYYGTAIRVDIVKYNGHYYIARTDAGNGFKNKVPTDTNYWNDFGAEFESVATQLLLAEMANIANFIFRNQRMESQGSTDGVANIILDGLRNVASFAAGKVKFENDKALIGWLQVVGTDLVGYDEKQDERIKITSSDLPSISSLIKWIRMTISAGASKSEVDVDCDGESFYATCPGFKTEIRDPWSDRVEYDEESNFSCYMDFTISEDFSEAVFDAQYGVTGASVDSSEGYVDVYTGTNYSTKVASGNLSDRFTTMLNKGKYRATFRMYANSSREWRGTMYIGMQGFAVIRRAQQTILAKDGLLSTFNGNYLKMQSSEGFEVKIGNYGLRVNSSSGIQKTSNNGSTWTSL